MFVRESTYLHYMNNFIAIQSAFFCENCRDCGARPVVEQVKGSFVVRCPNNNKHYKTKPGLIDQNLKDWNLKNKVHSPMIAVPSQKAS